MRFLLFFYTRKTGLMKLCEHDRFDTLIHFREFVMSISFW